VASAGLSSTITATAIRMAAGTIEGQHWTLWSKRGEKGSAALEDAGLVLDGTLNTFDDGRLLLAQTARLIDGTSFFIGKLPASACSYRSLELDVKAGHNSSQHNLGFGTCALGKLVEITDSMGSWSGP
jgi:hypothetical protein